MDTEIRTGFDRIEVVITPTNCGLNIRIEIQRDGKTVSMVMPGMPENRAQAILDAISGRGAT